MPMPQQSDINIPTIKKSPQHRRDFFYLFSNTICQSAQLIRVQSIGANPCCCSNALHCEK